MAIPGYGRIKSRRIFREWQGAGCPENRNKMYDFLVGAIHESPELFTYNKSHSEWDHLIYKWVSSARWAGGLEKMGIFLIVEPDYLWCVAMPESDRPFALFIRGEESLLHYKGEAVIGCRYPTSDGYDAAFQEGRNIAKNGKTVISGLALGCDTAGHRGALDAGGKTLAFMPCGLSRMYPPVNRGLAHEILDKGGALVSEYLPRMSPAAWRFIDRDRLQAALSDRLFVAECSLEGGTWHTIRFARKYGAEIDISRHFDISNPAESQKGNAALYKNPDFLPISYSK